MPRGGYRPGAGRPRKNELEKIITDEQLTSMSIIEIENSNLRHRVKDMLIQYKLDTYKAGVTKKEVDMVKREFELIYEFMEKFGLIDEFERFIKKECTSLLSL